MLLIIRYHLKHDIAQRSLAMSNQSTQIENWHLSLMKQIDAYNELQQAYMPSSLVVMSPLDLMAVEDTQHQSLLHPESIPLHLPSGVINANLSLPSFIKLDEMEAQLCFAQASDALDELRRSLCICAHFEKYKIATV
jgi:hypothetical protein